jgi:hypothetical protein
MAGSKNEILREQETIMRITAEANCCLDSLKELLCRVKSSVDVDPHALVAIEETLLHLHELQIIILGKMKGIVRRN